MKFLLLLSPMENKILASNNTPYQAINKLYITLHSKYIYRDLCYLTLYYTQLLIQGVKNMSLNFNNGVFKFFWSFALFCTFTTITITQELWFLISSEFIFGYRPVATPPTHPTINWWHRKSISINCFMTGKTLAVQWYHKTPLWKSNVTNKTV